MHERARDNADDKEGAVVKGTHLLAALLAQPQMLLGRNSHHHFMWMRDRSPKKSTPRPTADSGLGPEPELKAREVLTSS